MLVGWGGNNGSTLTAGIIANREYVHTWSTSCHYCTSFLFCTSVLFCRGICWATKEKDHKSNYYGSITQASTVRVGSFNGEEIYAPFNALIPMVLFISIISCFFFNVHVWFICISKVNPNDIVLGGWDINCANMADAMVRAKVFDIDLQKKLKPYMASMVPLPGIYNADFIAANQDSRANNVIKGTKKEQVDQIIKDIRYNLIWLNLDI